MRALCGHCTGTVRALCPASVFYVLGAEGVSSARGWGAGRRAGPPPRHLRSCARSNQQANQQATWQARAGHGACTGRGAGGGDPGEASAVGAAGQQGPYMETKIEPHLPIDRHRRRHRASHAPRDCAHALLIDLHRRRHRASHAPRARPPRPPLFSIGVEQPCRGRRIAATVRMRVRRGLCRRSPIHAILGMAAGRHHGTAHLLRQH